MFIKNTCTGPRLMLLNPKIRQKLARSVDRCMWRNLSLPLAGTYQLWGYTEQSNMRDGLAGDKFQEASHIIQWLLNIKGYGQNENDKQPANPKTCDGSENEQYVEIKSCIPYLDLEFPGGLSYCFQSRIFVTQAADRHHEKARTTY